MDTGPILTPHERLSIMEDMGLSPLRSIPGHRFAELERRTDERAVQKVLAGAIVGAPAVED